MLLEERADLAVPDVGAFEVGRVAGAFDTLEARAGYMLVDLPRQLGPDEPVLVAGQEERRYLCRGVLVYRRGEADEPFAEVGRPRLVEAGDLGVEERADGLSLAERRAQSGVPQDRRARRARGGQLRSERGDLGVREVADRVRQDDRPEPLGRAYGGADCGPAAHRLGDQRGPANAEVIEQRQRVGRERGRTRAARDVRGLAEPSLIDADAPEFLGEDRHLLPPAQVVAARAMQEEQRGRVAAAILVVETEAVLDHERHERSPSRGPRVASAPRAVNAILSGERTRPWRPTCTTSRSRSSRANSRRGSFPPSSWSRR